jgi:hypothetical protein
MLSGSIPESGVLCRWRTWRKDIQREANLLIMIRQGYLV